MEQGQDMHVGMTNSLTPSNMGFQPSKVEHDIWMNSTDDRQAYEYIAAYEDDL